MLILYNTRCGQWVSDCVAGAKTDERNCENWPANAKTATGIIIILYRRLLRPAAGASNSPPHRPRPLPRSRSPPVTRTYRWLLPFPFPNAERVTSIVGYYYCRKHTHTHIHCVYSFIHAHTVSRFSRKRDDERRLHNRGASVRDQTSRKKTRHRRTTIIIIIIILIIEACKDIYSRRFAWDAIGLTEFDELYLRILSLSLFCI